MDDRYIILQCLNKIIYENKLSHEILNKERENKEYSNFDYIEKVVKGVLEDLTVIDSLISKHSKTKLEKIKPIILLILRQTIYEIKFLDSIPSYASINEAGKLVKKYKMQGLLPYVNGVLRTIDRELINKTNNEAKEIGRNNNYTNNQANNTNDNKNQNHNIKKHTYIRINTFENETVQNIQKQNIELISYNGNLLFEKYKVFDCKNIKELIQTKEFINGEVSIQDASSIYLVENIYLALEKYNFTKHNIKILDTCASPGGKSMALYHLLKHENVEAKFTLCDKTKYKIDLIQKNLEREKIKNFNLQIQDATKNNSENQYDLIICDVPCSGLGAVSKKQDILLKVSKEKIQELQFIQKQIIDQSLKHLNANSIFSYSTCTTTKEENEENKDYIIKQNSNLELIFEKNILPNDNNNCDGFYMAIFISRK